MTGDELALADLIAEIVTERVAEQLGTAITPELVDAQAAAQLLSVPATWLLAEARANRIPHIRLGKYVRFRPADLIEWLDAKENR